MTDARGGPAGRSPEGPVGMSLFQLSYPLFLQSMVTLAVMVLDAMIWSAHSPQTVAALGVGAPILRIAFELSTLLGIGAVIRIAQHLGRGEDAAAREVAGVACAANAVLGCGIGAGLALAGPLAIGAMELDPGVAADAKLYLRLSGAAMAFQGFAAAAIACLRGFGESRLVLGLGLFGAALYLGLEYLLVLGAGPIPAMGAAGAGLGNLVLRIVVAAALVAVVLRRLGLRLSFARAWAQLGLVRRLAGLALPSVSDYVAYAAYQIVLIGVIAAQGTTAVLSRTYVMIALSFLTLVIMAICQGTEVLIGYRLGAGAWDAAHRQGLRSAGIASALSTACAGVLWLGAEPFIALFNADPAVLDQSRRLLWLTIFLQPCFSFNVILFHALRAVEDVRWPVVVSQSLTWGLGLPLAWALCGPIGLGIEGVWWAFIVEEGAKALAMLWRWNGASVRAAQASGAVAPKAQASGAVQ